MLDAGGDGDSLSASEGSVPSALGAGARKSAVNEYVAEAG